MRIKLVEGAKDAFLSSQREYVVLSTEIINKDHSSFISFRVIPDKGCPILIPSNIVEITSNKLSSYWVIDQTDTDFYTLEPVKWLREGFWEDYYNDEPEAIKDFETEKNKIFAEEGF